jgi:iron-sulfur cluster assembly accessory protein
MNISITGNAWKKLVSIAGNKGSFLLSAKSGGCNGYIYNISRIDYNKSHIKGDKEAILRNEGISVYVDKKAEFILQGTTIDYEKGLYEEKFVFNINSGGGKSKCGCGKSFSI